MRIPSRLLVPLLFAALIPAAPAVSRHILEERPLTFEPNRGQSDARVCFLARASGQTIFITRSEVVMVLHSGFSPGQLRLGFPGRRGDLAFEPEGLLAGRNNYLRGRDPARWCLRVPTYSRLRAPSVYPGVDLLLHGNSGRLEFDFIVAPGADPSRIRLRYDAPVVPVMDADGNLVFRTPAGVVRQNRPIAYQEGAAGRREIRAEYVLTGSGDIAFRLGDYDRGRELVIDPVIGFSTFLGGAGLDEARGIAVDQQGYVYVAGATQSPDFPATGGSGYHSGPLPGDAFVTKLKPDGSGVGGQRLRRRRDGIRRFSGQFRGVPDVQLEHRNLPGRIRH